MKNDATDGKDSGLRLAPSHLAVIVTGNVVIGEGLRSLLSRSAVEVAGLLRPGREALARIRALAPELIFLEAEALAPSDPWYKELRNVAPRAAIIVVGFHEPVHVAEAVAVGATAYLCRDVALRHLQLTVDAALQGYLLLERSAFEALSPFQPQGPTAHDRGPVATMTPREWEVLDLIAQGLGNGEIAARLVVSLSTVRSHVSHILNKLQVPDRMHAALWAAQHGPGSARQPVRRQPDRRRREGHRPAGS